MIRSDLEFALARDDSSSARAALLALPVGADLELLSEGHQATSPRSQLDISRHQQKVFRGVN
ncbi:hypothetical protein [Streptomyces flaveolus]|uniref:hypothetical protein n=1 Tax=Streptomyces flaveolus TaxID=67297 RepID=UPI00331C7DB5